MSVPGFLSVVFKGSLDDLVRSSVCRDGECMKSLSARTVVGGLGQSE